MNHSIFGCIFVLLSSYLNKSQAQVYGCTDPQATNYNSSATNNDGSCLYSSIQVAPDSTFILSSNVIETSGLINFNNQLWTHNDNTDNYLYTLDTIDGSLQQAYQLSGVTNYDWEEISQDSQYVYVGDFGNNGNGNRTDLKILRIEKNSLLLNSPVIDSINFSYSDQLDFTPTGNNNTDFDCEAFIVSRDSIYLFTKQWLSLKTSLYVLPKMPGSYSAILKATYDVQGLVTGATFMEDKKLIALCGYSTTLQPFTTLLYDYIGTDYFSGNKRKLILNLPLHQVEGISTVNGLKYYFTNESFVLAPFINTPEQMHIVDLSPYLYDYLYPLSSSINNHPSTSDIILYPNPASDEIRIYSRQHLPQDFQVINQLGQVVLKGKTMVGGETNISIKLLSAGVYIVQIGNMNYELMKE